MHRFVHSVSRGNYAFIALPRSRNPYLVNHVKPSSHPSAANMSDDEGYSNFLDKANKQSNSSKNVSTASKPTSTKTVDTEVPVQLQKIDQYYTSEADEPFEPVSLKWTGKNMPSESKLLPCKCSGNGRVHSKANVPAS